MIEEQLNLSPDMCCKIIVPSKLLAVFQACEVITDRHVPDDQVYVIDSDARVHCFEYRGRIPREGDKP